jgi:hypothetical protein
MIKKIKIFLQDRRTKKQLKNVLQLLYSETTFETTIELMKALQPKNDIEKLEYHTIIEVACKLNRPFDDENLTEIYQEQVKALEGYSDSKELREIIMELERSKANLSLINFNYRMWFLRSALQDDQWSPGGMKLRKLIAKGGPLTEKEELEVNKAYQEIKRLDEVAKAKLKELEDAIRNSS